MIDSDVESILAWWDDAVQQAASRHGVSTTRLASRAFAGKRPSRALYAARQDLARRVLLRAVQDENAALCWLRTFLGLSRSTILKLLRSKESDDA